MMGVIKMKIQKIQNGTKKALCILLSLILTFSCVLVLKSNVDASSDDLSVIVKTDKNNYTYNENVTVYVTVLNNSEQNTYKNILVSPSGSQYYSANKTTHEAIDELKPNTNKTISFNVKLSEKANGLNLMQRIILFIRYLFTGKIQFNGNYNGKYKKTASLEVS